MTLTAVDTGGSIGFSCSSTGVGTDITAYLPSSCDTGEPVVLQSGGIDYGTPWEGSFGDGGSTACWKGDSEGGWVVGPNALDTDDLLQATLKNQATNGMILSQANLDWLDGRVGADNWRCSA